MDLKEKQLLLADLCARLPYGVKVLGPWKKDGPCELSAIDLTSSRQIRVFEDWFRVEDVRPYLRPMSSMTEEERNEYFDFRSQELQRVAFAEVGREEAISEVMDWLLSHHFDFRGLISLGLALEAPERMYGI
jgi:hypothetical protein